MGRPQLAAQQLAHTGGKHPPSRWVAAGFLHPQPGIPESHHDQQRVQRYVRGLRRPAAQRRLLCDGGLDFRNDCGEAISACITDLGKDQLDILSAADALLDAALLDAVFAESDEAFEAVRSDTIQGIIDLGEPEVFKAYQEKWDAAAEVIVPLVMAAQRANGIEPYAPEEYEKLPYVK